MKNKNLKYGFLVIAITNFLLIIVFFLIIAIFFKMFKFAI
jgi:hypothetical protein